MVADAAARVALRKRLLRGGRVGALTGVVWLMACDGSVAPASPAPEPAATVVARLGERAITVDEVSPGASTTQEQRRRLVDQAVARVVLAEEARTQGLADSEDVVHALALVRARARVAEEDVLRKALYDSLRAGVAVDETSLRAHYEANRGRFVARQYTISWLDYESEAAARAALQGVGPDFESAPVQRIGPAPIDALPAKVLPELFSAKPGVAMLAGTIDEGVGLLLLHEVPAPTPLPFERVRDRVEDSLRTLRGQDRVRSLVEEARARTDVIVSTEAIEDDALWAVAQPASVESGPPTDQAGSIAELAHPSSPLEVAQALRARLAAGQIEAALELIHPIRRASYASIYGEGGSTLARTAESMSNLRVSDLKPDRATVRFNAPADDGRGGTVTLSFPMNLIRAADGAWYVEQY